MTLQMSVKQQDQVAKDLATAQALKLQQDTAQSAQAAHVMALTAVASRSPFGRDLIRHLHSGKTIEQAFGLAATHYAKINAKAGLAPILERISNYAREFGLTFPRNKLLNLRRNVEHIVGREQEAGRQIN